MWGGGQHRPRPGWQAAPATKTMETLTLVGESSSRHSSTKWQHNHTPTPPPGGPQKASSVQIQEGEGEGGEGEEEGEKNKDAIKPGLNLCLNRVQRVACKRGGSSPVFNKCTKINKEEGGRSRQENGEGGSDRPRQPRTTSKAPPPQVPTVSACKESFAKNKRQK